MPVVRETKLPGIGVRHEFTAADGSMIGVVEFHDGHFDVVVYDRVDPDRCTSMLHLAEEDTRTLASLLGASQITASLGDVQQQIEGLLFRWIEIPATSPAVGHTIGEGQYRTRTGASIVAVLRGAGSVPAPGPEFVIEAGDTAVAVGTTDGLESLGSLLAP
jgi:TrkA domain protein